MIALPTFDSVLVTGSQTIQQDLQVNGNTTVGTHLNVTGSETIAGDLQVNGNQTVANHLGTGGDLDAEGSVWANFRVGANNLPALPAGGFSIQQVRFYAGGSPSQPGLLLKGTDGLNYVLFVDVSFGTPSLAIVPA
ncbi:hypothetical protein [Paenibacillus tepidiphilus]|uniref:hypothetical protein n=1 Tax=Paenibacillus tepidiphilus TaxID=2608683 RepID=UPI001EF08A3C|nr:hypothetical protein [Paenibacillus tepidiphilus]